MSGFLAKPTKWQVLRWPLLIVFLLLVLSALPILFDVVLPPRAHPSASRRCCSRNLGNIGLLLGMYAQDYNGQYPPDLFPLFSTGIANSSDMLICLRDHGRTDHEKKLMSKPFVPKTASTLYTNYDYRPPGKSSGKDPSTVPVLWDKAGNHDNYRNIYFLDGKVRGVTEDEWHALVMGHPNPQTSYDEVQLVHTADKVELVFNRGYSADPTSEWNQKHPVEKTVLEDPKQVNAFLLNVKLVPKPPCDCEHGRMIVFWKGRKKLEVSICESCFDIMVEGKVKTFEMPKSLYGRFQKSETQFRQK